MSGRQCPSNRQCAGAVNSSHGHCPPSRSFANPWETEAFGSPILLSKKMSPRTNVLGASQLLGTRDPRHQLSSSLPLPVIKLPPPQFPFLITGTSISSKILYSNAAALNPHV